MKDTKILTAGDSSLLIQFGQEISPEINAQITAFVHLMREQHVKGVTDVIPAFTSLLINYDPRVIDYRKLKHRLEKLLKLEVSKKSSSSRIFEIQVCYGGKYGPDLPVRRYTMALQAIRAMGFVGAAETVSTADLAFSDNAEIQEWVKGYVKLATQYGVMNGYPDGSFGPKRTATRAEAVVTVARALDYNRGDGEIQASMELYRYFAYPHGSESAEPFVTNRVRMLAADGRIYVNARDLFTEIGVDGGWRWFPTRQVLYVSGGNTSYKFQMGNDYWVGRSQQDFAYAEPTPRDNELLGIVRFYNGNPMLPLHDFNRPVHSPEGFLWSNFQGEWDAATRTLSFSICDPTPNGS